MDIESLQNRWLHFEGQSFPLGHRTKIICGKNLTAFASEVGGLILSFIASGGCLGGRQAMMAGEYTKNAAVVVAELQGEAKLYFEELAQMLTDVSSACDISRH
jgi:hypothetical protein